MQVRVIFYGGLQRVAGAREVTLHVSEKSLALKDLADHLIAKHPELKIHLKTALFSVGAKIASLGEVIEDGAEVGLLPPVSGG